MVRHMTKEDRDALRLAFEVIDADKDGYITENEIYEFVKNSGLDSNAARARAKEMMEVSVCVCVLCVFVIFFVFFFRFVWFFCVGKRFRK